MVQDQTRETSIRARHIELDQRLSLLEEKTFAAFEKALKAPIGDVSALRKLLAEKAPWEK